MMPIFKLIFKAYSMSRVNVSHVDFVKLCNRLFLLVQMLYTVKRAQQNMLRDWQNRVNAC